MLITESLSHVPHSLAVNCVEWNLDEFDHVIHNCVHTYVYTNIQS